MAGLIGDNWYGEKANGKGTMTLANGDVIEGEWKDNELNGNAFYKNANGKVWIMKASSLVDLQNE